MAASTQGRLIKFGHTSVVFPSDQLQQMEDCSHLLGDFDALHREMDDKG